MLKDVCDAIGLNDPQKVKARLDEDERNLISLIDSIGRKQQTSIVSESGLYGVILRSDKKEAESFRRWVTHDVIPSIRKTGLYSIYQKRDSYMIEDSEERAKRWIEEYHERKQLETTIKEQKPKVLFADTVCKSKDNILIRTMAKILTDNGFTIGQKRLYKLLRDKKILMDNNEPYQRYMESGYFVYDEVSVETPYGEKLEHTTKITPEGQIWITSKIKDWKEEF